MPSMGFGTWQDKDSQESAVETALKAGYRHIDTAHIYGTEPMVGKGIKKSGVPRDQIFVGLARQLSTAVRIAHCVV